MIKRKYILLISMCLTACTAGASLTPAASLPPSPEASRPPQVKSPSPAPTNVRIEDKEEYRIPNMLGFDAIRPVYQPRFAAADEADLLFDDELVMGIALGGEAKAYPVTVMRLREMVDDELAGWPILVSW